MLTDVNQKWKTKLPYIPKKAVDITAAFCYTLIYSTIIYLNSLSSRRFGKKNRKVRNSLDPFYTKTDIAAACWQHFTDILLPLNRAIEELYFVEPAAGTGAFYAQMPPHRSLGIDIAPKSHNIIKQDFFNVTHVLSVPRDTAIVGNPPFGKRGKLAIAFFNHAASLVNIVAFIVPVNFRKWRVHKQLDASMRFISKLALPREAFQLSCGRPFSVNTEFQIWTRLPFQDALRDMRRYQPLPINHKDFRIWQYNNTTAALKVFQNSFDFAVPCQGWQDYSRKETDEKRCERNKQWMLFKATSPGILGRLMCIDYERLARECGTAVPGFRKGDLVKEYSERYET